MAERKISVSLEGRMDSLSRTLQQAESETDKHTRAMRSGFDRVDGGITSVGRSLGNLAAATGISGAAVTAFGYELIRAGLAAEKLQMQFKATTGSAALAEKELDYIRNLSDRLGLSFQETATSYGKFLASTRNTAIEGEPAKRVFVGVSEAVTGLGLSAEESQGIFLALSQMMSKGKVSADELTQQLGERLPGSLQLAADAMGLTTNELLKQMEQGKIMSADLLPKLAEELHKTYGTAAEEASTKGQAAINRMNNEILETKQILSKSLMPAFTDLTTSATNGLETMIRKMGESKIIWAGWLKTAGIAMKGGPLGMNWMTAKGRAEISAEMAAQEQMTTYELLKWNQRFDGEGVAGSREPNPAPAPSGGSGGSGGSGPSKTEKAAAATRRHAEEQRQLNEGMKVGAEMVQLYYKELDELAAIQRQMDEDRQRADAEAEGNSEGRLNYYGRMSERQQVAFDRRSMESGWAARNAETERKAAEQGSAFSAFRAGANGDPFAQARLQLQQEEDAWVQHWAMMTDSEEEYDRRRTEIAAVYAAERNKINQAEMQMRIGWAASGFSSMTSLADSFYQLSGKKSKAAFEVGKAMKIGETVANTATAAMEAYKAMAGIPYVGPALGAAAAAAAIAAGAVQIKNIKSASASGGGTIADINPNSSTGSYGAGTPTSPIVTQPSYATTQPVGNTTFIIQGNIMEDKYVEERLIPLLNSAGTRNVRVEYLN